jgi:hypothetical protein
MSSVIFRTIGGRVVPIKVASGTPGAYPDNRQGAGAGRQRDVYGVGTQRPLPRFRPDDFRDLAPRPSSDQIADWYRSGVPDREIARRLGTDFDDPMGFVTQMEDDVISGFSRRGSAADELLHVGRESADRATIVRRNARPAGKVATGVGVALGVAGIAADTYLGVQSGESGRRAFAGAGGAFVGGVAGAAAGTKAGAAAGAGIGAVLGSVIPVVGTAAGAAAGATVGAIGGAIAGGAAGGFAGGWATDRIDDRVNGPNARTKGWGGQQIR